MCYLVRQFTIFVELLEKRIIMRIALIVVLGLLCQLAQADNQILNQLSTLSDSVSTMI
jgi:hypothetical protein